MGWHNPKQAGQSVRARLGRDPVAWPQPDFPDWIRTLPLPHASNNRTVPMLLIFVGMGILFVIGLVSAVHSIVSNDGRLPDEEWITYGFMLLVPVLFLLALWADRIRERRFRTWRLRSTRWATMLGALADARIPFRRCRSGSAASAWSRLTTSFDARELAMPRTIADLRVATELCQLPLPDELVEPEKVASGSRADRKSRRNSIIFGVAIVVFSIIIDGGWMCTGLGLFMILVPLLSLQIVRTIAPDLLLGFSTVIAGPGFVHFSDDLIFRSGSAICMLRSIGSTRWTDSAVEACFYSADGVRMLSFPSVHDPQFVRLWQRWNHPQPRPELAGTA